MENQSAMERQQVEIELLQAMYPDQIYFDRRSGDFRYTASNGSSLLLRIPDSYPEHELPDVMSAIDKAKNDIRLHVKARMSDMQLSRDEEVLDAIVQCFEEVLTAQAEPAGQKSATQRADGKTSTSTTKSKTVVVWLHHLLNTNKRKLALNPTLNAVSGGRMISGVTKPGYPGILVYSGPTELVDAHVAELKHQRWQAFQVRFEEEYDGLECWRFKHGEAIREVESISDVVQSIIGEPQRETFLKATGVK